MNIETHFPSSSLRALSDRILDAYVRYMSSPLGGVFSGLVPPRRSRAPLRRLAAAAACAGLVLGLMNYRAVAAIWSMDVTASHVPVRPFLEYSGTIYYGLTVNPANGEVYIADAIDYQQQGMIYRYSPEGKLIDEFYVGIIPGAFCWK